MSDLKKARLIHMSFVVFALVCTFIAYTVFSSVSQPTTSYWIYAGLALYSANSGFYFRRKYLGPAHSLAAKDRKFWLVGQLSGWACALAIVLSGFLAAMDAAFIYAVPFFLVGIALLLLWTPRASQLPQAE